MLAALANHLWQSTLFALAAALLTLIFRNNRARVRYSLWFAASAKFLIPVGALTAVGAQIPWFSSVEDVPRPLMSIVGRLTAEVTPVGGPGATAIAPVDHVPLGGMFLITLAVLWALGVVVVAARRSAEWRLVQRAVRDSYPTPIPFIVPVRSSVRQLEPFVVGILRPVLLLPAGIGRHLNPNELRAVLAHERCHVLYRDNLAATLHMLVEVLFWFHPLVWWLGKRLVEERERACDEHVLQTGHSPESYSEGILKICEYYLTCTAAGAASVTGASLKKRIDQILNCQPIRRLGVLRKVVLVVCLGAPIALPVMAGVGWHTYTTAVGGLKRIVLDDQIDIVMNTSTTLRARRTGARRDFVLAAGEALFEAPHTLWHPLYVTAESALLVSSGASFSVRIHEPDTVEVLVKEGSVDLRAIRESSPAGSQRSTARLSAGDAATIVHGVATVQRLPAEEIIRTLAWTSGRLWFDRVTLDEAVAEFNRYNRQQLEIDDPRIAALRMGGAFDATDLYSFTAALETFGITAKRDPGAEVEPGGGTFHLSRAPAGR